jgi:inorganic pyrophosphatase
MTPLNQLPAFVSEDVFHVVVESPRGSSIKLKYDAELGAMSVSRPLPAGLRYPFDWGFVPSTRGDDGDPVDAMLYWMLPPIRGWRSRAGLRSAVALPERVRNELGEFFIAATVLERKDPRILGWAGPEAALALVKATRITIP